MSDATRLRVQAERCFRLARGPASAKLADELEALGRAFERDARKVEASLLHRSVQWRGAEATRFSLKDCHRVPPPGRSRPFGSVGQGDLN
jgi:hypothetical protein